MQSAAQIWSFAGRNRKSEVEQYFQLPDDDAGSYLQRSAEQLLEERADHRVRVLGGECSKS